MSFWSQADRLLCHNISGGALNPTDATVPVSVPSPCHTASRLPGPHKDTDIAHLIPQECSLRSCRCTPRCPWCPCGSQAGHQYSNPATTRRGYTPDGRWTMDSDDGSTSAPLALLHSSPLRRCLGTTRRRLHHETPRRSAVHCQALQPWVSVVPAWCPGNAHEGRASDRDRQQPTHTHNREANIGLPMRSQHKGTLPASPLRPLCLGTTLIHLLLRRTEHALPSGTASPSVDVAHVVPRQGQTGRRVRYCH